MLPAALAVAHFEQIALPARRMHCVLQAEREFANVLSDISSILNGFASLAMRPA